MRRLGTCGRGGDTACEKLLSSCSYSRDSARLPDGFSLTGLPGIPLMRCLAGAR